MHGRHLSARKDRASCRDVIMRSNMWMLLTAEMTSWMHMYLNLCTYVWPPWSNTYNLPQPWKQRMRSEGNVRTNDIGLTDATECGKCRLPNLNVMIAMCTSVALSQINTSVTLFLFNDVFMFRLPISYSWASTHLTCTFHGLMHIHRLWALGSRL